MRSKLELVADGFSFPTAIAIDHEGTAYVAESGLQFDGAAPGGHIWRVGRSSELLKEGLRAPVTGLVFYEGGLYLSEGGNPGRITRLGLDGSSSTIIDGLPGAGNYHTNTVAIATDGWLYFGQGALTNTGVVGLDALELAWLRHVPDGYDTPGFDVVLAGERFETADPRRGGDARAITGAFAPFGSWRAQGQRVRKSLPCTASVMRLRPDGTQLELVAWGLRNAFGLGFLPDGRLLAIDQGADDRGSRPVGDAPDLVFEVKSGAWYGWPDFIGGIPITDERFTPVRGQRPTFLLTNHGELPPPERALARLPSHTAAAKFDVGPDGTIYLALFGDERPLTAPPGEQVGRGVARLHPSDWSVTPFLSSPLLRPIDVKYSRTDGALYILDFGHFEMNAAGFSASARTGKLWRLRL